MHLHFYYLSHRCWHRHREAKQRTFAEQKTTIEEMLLAPESRVRHDIDFKNWEK
jgi:hypothetical protein